MSPRGNSQIARIAVRSRTGNYPVVFASGSLARLGRMIEPVREGGEIFVLSSPRVWHLWGRAVLRGLRNVPRRRVILFDDHEIAKRLATVEKICRKLSLLRADRHALLVAVGGGVVGDVAGFSGASYLRGVRIVHVPTTVVAQADSSIGGKTGVDLPEGKNLVGAFHPPCMVIVDPAFLKTLPPRQFRSGLYEVIKCGAVADRALFQFLEREMDLLLRMDARAVAYAIERSARWKARVVIRDEFERGGRQILNFGHTIGHALETLTRYRRFLHGEAVAWGMLAAALIAVGMGKLSERDAARLAQLISRCGSLPSLPRVSSTALLRAIAGDKKSRAGRVRWVLPHGIGAAQLGVTVPDNLVAAVWRELPSFFARARRETI